MGHHIYYSYITMKAGLALSKISYNNNRYQIGFEYKNIPDLSKAVFLYSKGIKRVYDQLLDKVTVSVQANILKSYLINYTDNNGRYQIETIDCRSGNKALAPLNFTYGDGENKKEFELKQTQLSNYFSYEKPSEMVVQRAKFKYGTSSDGLIIYPNHISNFEYWRHGTSFRHSKDYFSNQYSETQEIIVADGMEDNFAFNKGKLLTGKGFQGILCGDIDNNQGDEVVRFNEYLENDKDYTEITSYTPNIYGSLVKTHSFKKSFNDQITDCHKNHSIIPKSMYIGDFNGDGSNEILAVAPANVLGSNNKTRLYIIDMVSERTIYEVDAPFTFNKQFAKINTRNGKVVRTPEDAEYQSDKLFIQDVDGDGKADIVLIGSDGTCTYTFNTSGNSISGCSQLGFETQLKTANCDRRKVFQADLNGDNIPDIFLTPAKLDSRPTKYTRDYSIYFAKGDGTYEKTTRYDLPDYYEDRTDFFEDVDLDGTSDYVVYSHNTGKINVYTFKNGTRSGYLEYNVGKNSIVVPADISSYSKVVSILSVEKSGLVKKLVYKDNEFNNLLMAGYTNSYGVAKEFKYRNLYNSTSIQGHNARFPFVNYNGPLVITTNYKETTNNDIVRNLNFRYANAVLHKRGRGFRGYEKIYTHDLITGETQEDLYDVYHEGLLLSSSNNRESITNTYNYRVDANKINNTTLQKSVVVNHVNNLTTTVSYVYDEYGNIKEKNTDFGNGYVKNDSYAYKNIDKADTYLLGLPLTEAHNVGRQGQTANSTIVYYYNGSHQISKKRYFVNGSNIVNTTDYEYNSTGLKTKVTNRSFNSNVAHSTLFRYDGNGLLISKTGEDGLVQDFSYNNKDQISCIKNYIGSTFFVYDEWGNLILSKGPDGTEENTERSWAKDYPEFCYYTLHKVTGKPYEITYYDALGRIVREGRQRFDGMCVYVDKKYNNKGQLVELTEPFQSSPLKKTTYSYDQYDRVVKVNKPNGSVEEYTYGKLSTTVKENGKSTLKTYNELGDLLFVESVNGKVSYEYTPNGDISKITSPGNIIRTFGYDAHGRRNKIEDPQAGSKSFVYDDEGKVVRESSLSDNTKDIHYTYDAHGHVIQKVYSNYTMMFEYNQYGELVLEHKSDGTYSKTISYDGLHRMSRVVTKGEDGNSLTLDFGYSGSNLASTKYTTGKGLTAAVGYTYRNGVMAKAISNGGKVLWELTAENEQGEATDYKSLAIRNNCCFDENAHPSSISTFNGNTLLYQENYRFDALTGNLTSRSNHHGFKEEFAYDGMDRLIKINDHFIKYDELGNITENSIVGKFEYVSAKPYAVSEITPYRDVFFTGDQKITYNALSKPLTIEEGECKACFTYGTDDERSKMGFYLVDGLEMTKYYFGPTYEVVDDAAGYTEYLYLLGDAYNAPVVIVNNNGNEKLYSIVRDYLGSIKAIYDEDGKLVQELSYDAWGRLRNPSTGEVYQRGKEPELFLGRGYTGHEHLQVFALINMNGRLYDSVIGRFLNPDPVIQDVQNAQNYNSYSYVLNNPLKYTDKSGRFCISVLIGCIVGAYIGGCFANHNANPLKWNWSNTETYLGVTFGAVLGAVGGSAAAGLGFDLVFSIATPFVAVGVEVAVNRDGKAQVKDYGYGTVAGGGWSHGTQVATEKTEKAYNDAISTAHEVRMIINEDLSNHPISSMDAFSNSMDYMGGHPEEWAGEGYYVLDREFGYYLYKNEMPEGVKFIKIRDFAGKACKWASRGCMALDGISTGVGVIDEWFSSDSERVKYEKTGEAIGSFIGGWVAGVGVGFLTSGTGPAAIGFGVVAGALGSSIGRITGRFVGGFIYDIHSVNSTIQSEIDGIQPYIQNFNNGRYVY